MRSKLRLLLLAFIIFATPLSAFLGKQTRPLYVQEVYDEGRTVVLSDGSAYEVAPWDRFEAKFWISVSSVRITPAGNEQYPWRITDRITGQSINVRRIHRNRSRYHQY